MKKGAAFCLALWLLCSLQWGVLAAAKDPVTLAVDNKTATVTLNNSTLATIPLYDTDVRLQTTGSKLSLRFNTGASRTQSVDLDDSMNVKIDGDLRSLTVGSSVPAAATVAVNQDKTVSTLTNYSPAKITVSGTVGDLTARGASAVTVDATGYITTARLIHPQSSVKGNGTVELALVQQRAQASAKGVREIRTLSASTSGLGFTEDNGYYSYYRYYSTPNMGNDRAGLYVDHTEPVRSDWSYVNAANNMRKNGMYFEIAPMYVLYGTLLRQLYSSLTNNVRITSGTTGGAMSGRVVWLENETTRVTTSGYYRFMFIPDDTAYPSTTASIYLGLETERGPYGVQIWLDKTEIAYYPDPYYNPQLWELQQELNNAVYAYVPGTRRPVSGVFRWNYPNTILRFSGYHSFTFTPDDTAYRSVSDSVYIDVKG